MSMRISKYLVFLVSAIALVACGGGGGSAGSTTTATNTGGGTPATGGVVVPIAAASMSMDILSGAGVSTRSISAIEISKVSIVLKDAAGKPVPGSVVTFAEKGGSLLTIAPVSKTALTDASGVASVEIRAASGTAVGATTVGASATVAAVVVTAELSIAITSAPTGGVTNPQDLTNALNFLDVNPADKSIVLAGSGGNGRSESATLRFRVVDKNNTPVKGAVATFSVAPAGDVTLNISSATSDADGVVVTTVSSKSVATAVVITATVTRAGGTVTSQSDQLLVTTGISTPTGFDLSAAKYNMNSSLTGDATTITVRIVDANGNPVADGVPVVFTAPFGAVGSSSRGGCVTSGGGCTVDYKVQDPRPADGQLATVTASTQISDGSSISETLDFRFARMDLLNLFFASRNGLPVSSFTFGASCNKLAVSAFVGTPANFPAPAATTVELKSVYPGFTAALLDGSPILDQLSSPPERTPVYFELDIAGATGGLACVAGAGSTATAQFTVKFTAGSITSSRLISVSYPVAP
jgi:protocatechuate 3,4-dioxygenase beta subunit